MQRQVEDEFRREPGANFFVTIILSEKPIELVTVRLLFVLSVFQMLLLSQDYGKHLLGVEDLLQKHALVEADIGIQADRVKAVTTNANKYSGNDSGEQW